MTKLLRLPEVIAMTGKSRSSIYGDPLFPKRIKIGERSVAWVENEIEEWVEERCGTRLFC